MIRWSNYQDPALEKVTGPVRVELTREDDDGYGEFDVKFVAKIGETTVGELEVYTNKAYSTTRIQGIVVGPKKQRIGTRLYEAAARWACERTGKPLASDTKRSKYADEFWKKQVQKKRARCALKIPREDRRRLRESLSVTHDDSSAYGRSDCDHYVLKCPAPQTLERSRR